MYFDTFKRNYWKRIAICLGVLVVVLLVINFRSTQAKYSTSESIPLINGRVKYTPYDFKIMAMYQDNGNGGWTEISKMPSSGYTINEEKSYCYTTDPDTHDTSVELKTVDGNHVFNNLSKSSKCYLWFDEKPLVGSELIIANATSIGTRSDFSDRFQEENSNLYTTEDDDGTSYYFAGAATNNYVKFAGYFWRIIRVNGDGTVRLIYDGTTARANGDYSSGAKIGDSAFNENVDNNMYVGFRYTSGSVHGTGMPSTISGVLDTWYSSNLSSYSSYIDTNAGFCGDRTAYTNKSGTTNGGGTGTTTTYYAGYVRLVTNKAPSLKCTNSNDLYTKSGATKGNKSLTYPIGLITADELVYAGGVIGWYMSSYYLYTGNIYWTMTPRSFDSNYSDVFYECGSSDQVPPPDGVSLSLGVRPVINLRADVILSGDGTASNPYTIS